MASSISPRSAGTGVRRTRAPVGKVAGAKGRTKRNHGAGKLIEQSTSPMKSKVKRGKTRIARAGSEATGPIDASQLAALLREYAQRSALRGDNPYRAKA